MTGNEILKAASQLAENLKTDIPLAKTREEHIRVTARANEAAALVEKLKFFNGEGQKAASDGE